MGRFCFIFLASFCFMRKVFKADIFYGYVLSISCRSESSNISFVPCGSAELIDGNF